MTIHSDMEWQISYSSNAKPDLDFFRLSGEKLVMEGFLCG